MDDVYNKISKMNTVFGIWNYSDYLRVTYVAQGWLIVWDHRQSPPTRYDCKESEHDQACQLALEKLRELTAK